MRPDYDVVVVGSGAAGLSVAAGLAGARRVALLTATSLGGGGTAFAQGGLAVAVADDDDPAAHAADTRAAGAGLCEPAAVARLVEEAPLRLADLLALGGSFDRGPAGDLLTAREGGHRRSRVVHAGGDATGREVSRVLVGAVARGLVDVVEDARVDDLLLAEDAAGGPPAVAGVSAEVAGRTEEIAARAVVLATGGIGGVFRTTTNPPEVSGDGPGLALRAGATLTDLEFVQFHPTTLRAPGGGVGQRPLVTEALRGAGAVLVDRTGSPIMRGVHPMGDLAPRDVVARRVAMVASTDRGPVFLDASPLGRERLRSGFPTVYSACRTAGVDPALEAIPVEPAEHFLCGGVRADRWGATDVPGLFAVGEVAATGVHGANRLASNGLVEGLVYGRRAAARLALHLPPPRVGSRAPARGTSAQPPRLAPAQLDRLRALMTRAAGLRRDGVTLAAAVEEAAKLPAATQTLTALAVLGAALARTESRGCHWRADYPDEDPAPLSIEVRSGADGLPCARLAAGGRRRTPVGGGYA